MEEVEPEELVPAIEKLKHVTATFTLYGRVGMLTIVGRPDAIAFQDGKPRWVIELKTTSKNPAKLWTNHVVQVKTYGLLLDLMGFDVSELDLVLVRVSRNRATGSKFVSSLLPQVLDLLRTGHFRDFEAKHSGQVKFYIIPYDRFEAERDIYWAQEYWLKRREPIPAHSFGKCKACEFHGDCKYSLYRPIPQCYRHRILGCN